jgi:exodeoxyribonuclease V alpha subunit
MPYDGFDGFDELTGSRPPEGEEERRKGTVKKIIYERAGTNFKILQMELTDGSKDVWLGAFDVGEDAEIEKGDILEAIGRRSYSRRGDEQFQVSDLVTYLPGSKGGLVTWLMSRLPDIGQKRAAALAKEFPGEQLFSVMADYPDQLTRVSGITEERAQKIHEVYKEFAHEANTVIEMVDLGLGWIKVTRAVKALGVEEFKRTIREDAYQLVDQQGWSFNYIDKWLTKKKNNPYHMETDDPRRVRAKIRDVLEVLATAGSFDWDREGGDCYLMPRTVGHVCRTEGWISDPRRGAVGPYSPEQIAEILKESPYLAVRTHALFLADIDAAEREVAETLRERAVNDPVQTIPLPEREFPLDPSQKLAASALVQLPVACMTGGPGTGKTTTLRTALDAMAARGEVLALASFTGKAARRMGQATGRSASTIHRLLEWTPTGFKRDAENPIEADVVVIDEASMLDIRMASHLVEALSPHTRLLLVGDSNQLPPVGPGQPFTDVLRARHGNDFVVPVFMLTTTHRQAGENWVIDNAPKIINKVMPSLDPVESPDGDFRFYPASTTEEIVRLVVGAYRRARERGDEQQLQVLTPMRKPDPRATAHTINLEVQKVLNPNSASDDKSTYFDGGFNEKAQRYRIYEEDKVIFTRNMPKLGLSNGDTGVVVEIYMDSKNASDSYAKVRFDGLDDAEHPDGIYTLNGEHFQHVDLAYAMTVHKAQGSEWENVLFIADAAQRRMLKRQLFYTAVTRTSKNLRILGTVEGVRAAVNSEMSNNRWTKLTDRLLGVPV